MTKPRSAFLQTLTEREYLHQCTDIEALDARAEGGAIVAYIGFDCTAPSLHVGSLLPIMTLRALQRAGHKPIVLMGGGTTKIGDPSGRDESRRIMSESDIARNKAGIERVFARYLTFGEGATDAIMVDNQEWLGELDYIPFLRDFGRHFSVSRMLSMDSVRTRLDREQPLSFLEFNYMVLQSYDFLELSRRYDCVLQMGGSDQWGNITGGIELARRVDGRTLYGLTTPLITIASGAKMGKTAAGAVWLDADLVAPYEFWQYWRNTADNDVGRFLRLFTEVAEGEIVRLEALGGEEINEAKKVLASEATRLCHGEAAAEASAETARRTFEVAGMDEEAGAGEALPTIEVPRAELAAGIPVFELLHRAGLAASGAESRRLIKGGGGRLNDRVVESELQPATLADVGKDGTIKLSAGKKRHALVRPV